MCGCLLTSQIVCTSLAISFLPHNFKPDIMENHGKKNIGLLIIEYHSFNWLAFRVIPISRLCRKFASSDRLELVFFIHS